MNNLGDNFLNELEKLSEYFSYEMEIDYAMAPVFKFKHKITKKEYSYRLSMIDIKNYGGPHSVDTEKEVLALRCETTFVRINEYGEAIKISDNVRAKYPERSIRIEKES